MKKSILFFLCLFTILISCKDSVVEKPKKLISEDEMVNIIYDLSILEALKTQNSANLNSYPSNAELLKKKYKVDSLTFLENSKYYASDIKNYKEMFEKVKERMTKESAKLSKPVAQ